MTAQHPKSFGKLRAMRLALLICSFLMLLSVPVNMVEAQVVTRRDSDSSGPEDANDELKRLCRTCSYLDRMSKGFSSDIYERAKAREFQRNQIDQSIKTLEDLRNRILLLLQARWKSIQLRQKNVILESETFIELEEGWRTSSLEKRKVFEYARMSGVDISEFYKQVDTNTPADFASKVEADDRSLRQRLFEKGLRFASLSLDQRVLLYVENAALGENPEEFDSETELFVDMMWTQVGVSGDPYVCDQLMKIVADPDCTNAERRTALRTLFHTNERLLYPWLSLEQFRDLLRKDMPAGFAEGIGDYRETWKRHFRQSYKLLFDDAINVDTRKALIQVHAYDSTLLADLSSRQVATEYEWLWKGLCQEYVNKARIPSVVLRGRLHWEKLPSDCQLQLIRAARKVKKSESTARQLKVILAEMKQNAASEEVRGAAARTLEDVPFYEPVFHQNQLDDSSWENARKLLRKFDDRRRNRDDPLTDSEEQYLGMLKLAALDLIAAEPLRELQTKIIQYADENGGKYPNQLEPLRNLLGDAHREQVTVLTMPDDVIGTSYPVAYIKRVDGDGIRYVVLSGISLIEGMTKTQFDQLVLHRKEMLDRALSN